MGTELGIKMGGTEMGGTEMGTEIGTEGEQSNFLRSKYSIKTNLFVLRYG